MTDSIVLTGIVAYGYHGVFDFEQQQGQEFIVDVTLETDTSRAGYSDDIERTINYAEVIAAVVERVEGKPLKLIEALAEEIAELILRQFQPEAAQITIHKPHAPVEQKFTDIAVSIRRTYDHVLANTGVVPELQIQHEAAHKAKHSKLFQMADAVTTILSFGSNLGESKDTLLQAVAELDRDISVRVQRVSPIVRSAPVGGPEQPDYLNLIAEFKTTLSPKELLALIHKIEYDFGRQRAVRWGARTLDIDIITYGDLQLDTDELTIPHPRAHERAFVLYPWYLMNPAARFPQGTAVVDVMHDSIGIHEIEVFRET